MTPDARHQQDAAGKGPAINDQFMKDLQRYSEDADRKVALSVVAGVLLLAIALGITGIMVTHRVWSARPTV